MRGLCLVEAGFREEAMRQVTEAKQDKVKFPYFIYCMLSETIGNTTC